VAAFLIYLSSVFFVGSEFHNFIESLCLNEHENMVEQNHEKENFKTNLCFFICFTFHPNKFVKTSYTFTFLQDLM
jgi:hypothetical protein